MNLFRRLTAEIPGELLAARVAATSRASETAPVALREMAATDPYDPVFAILGAIADNPGVLTNNTPGLPVATRTEGDLQ